MSGPHPAVIKKVLAKYKAEHKFAQPSTEDWGIQVTDIKDCIKYRMSLMMKSPLFRGIYLDSIIDVNPLEIESNLKYSSLCVFVDGYCNSINFKTDSTIITLSFGGFGKWEYHMRSSHILAHLCESESSPIIQNTLINILDKIKELHGDTIPVNYKNTDYNVKFDSTKIPIKVSGIDSICVFYW